MFQSVGMWFEASPEMPHVGAPVVVCAAPLPLSEIFAGELVALLATERLPLALPAVLGAKATDTVAV